MLRSKSYKLHMNIIVNYPSTYELDLQIFIKISTNDYIKVCYYSVNF